MLTNVHAGLLVEIGRQIEAGSLPDFSIQLKKAFSGPVFGRENVTDIANSLSDEDVVFFFKGLVHFEKHERFAGGSVSSTIWAFYNIKDRMPGRTDELLDWALKNRGGNAYTPVGHTTFARSLEEYKTEEQEKISRRARRRLEEEVEQAEAKKRKKQKQVAHQKRIKRGVSNAKTVKPTLEKLAALSPSDRLRTLSVNEFPLEAVPMDLIDKDALEELPDQDLQKLLSRIDQRKGKWGSVAKSINRILERR